MSDLQWLTVEQIQRLNEILVEETGEPHGVISQPLLESALERPKNLQIYEGEDDPIILCVRLIEAVGKNHCFVQGNKRTAFNAGIAFLEVNGLSVTLPDTVEVAKVVEGVITGAKSPESLIELIRVAVSDSASCR